MVRVAPYGTWESPITADLVTASGVGIGSPVLDGEETYWTETRPTEKGRTVIVHRSVDGRLTDLTPPHMSVRTRVHEYGGAAFTVVDGVVYFVNFEDQHLYRQAVGQEPELLCGDEGMRFADMVPDLVQGRLICVREDHTGRGQPVNTLAAVNLEGGESVCLVSGNDFYASPRISPDGTRLAWITWKHPNMPWDGTELWVGELLPDGIVGRRKQVAGSKEESIFQPEWGPDGHLYFVSDRTGWWNLYRLGEKEPEPLAPLEAEFGLPQWAFGMSTYGFVAAERIVCAHKQKGLWSLSALNLRGGTLSPLPLPYTEITGITTGFGRVAFTGSSATTAPELVMLDLITRERIVLRRSTETRVDPQFISPAQPVEFPTDGDLTAYGLFYPPKNGQYRAPEGELPPLIVKSHGGPTASASATLSLAIQYWTSRGFAVLDVDYGGSTGYGREYRQRLNGNWGIVDVQDCVNGARYLAEQGLVDGSRLSITGGSAGGYTTLAALTFHDVFRAGVSFFGVSDLETLAADTHKFESRYLDRLVGPYPAKKDLYRARSPIHHTEKLSCPVIFFQGLDDRVVPPSQAEAMVEVLRQKGLPVAYIPFEGEGHGFRRAENNRRALEAQLYFYGRLYGFTPADSLEPVVIENL